MKATRIPLLVAALTALLATTPCVAEESQPKLQNLFKEHLAGELAKGLEVVVSLVEIPARTRLEMHWHPGEEFIYVLEGRGEVVFADGPPVSLAPGSVYRVPYRTVHTAATGDEPVKAIVFRVHPEGQPIRHLVDGESADK